MKYLKVLYILFPFFLSGCSDKVEEEQIDIPQWDTECAQVTIEICDTDGNNLFSDEYHGALDKQNLSASISYTYNV